MRTKLNILLTSSLLLLTLAELSASGASATLTAASGGGAISADTANGPVWTTLTGPVVTETSAGQIGTGTIIISVPSGFSFNTAAPVTVLVTGGSTPANNINGVASGSTIAATVTSSTITITISSKSSGTANSLTWQNLQVSPTAGTPLAKGNLSRSGTATGLPAGNWGSLTEVGGAPVAVRVETTADGKGTVVPAQNVSVNSSLTVYAVTRDQYGNFVANIAADAWSLVNETGGVVDGDLVPAGDSKSAVFTGHALGSATVHVVSGTLTPTDSGTLTVTAGNATKLFVTLPGQTFVPGVGNTGTPLPQTAGAPFVIQLTAIDNYTNIATSYSGSKNINYSGPGGAPTYTTPVYFTAGQSTNILNTTLTKAETVSLTASVAGVTAVPSASLTVNPGDFAKLQLLVPGETAAPGTATGKTGTSLSQTGSIAFNVTVNAVDAYWNLLNTVTDTVGLTSSDAAAVLPPATPLVNGTASLSVTLNTTLTQTLTASDITDGTKGASTSSNITVVSQFVGLLVLLPGETAAPGTPTGKTGTPTPQAFGTAFSVTVRAVDPNWNLVNTVTDLVGITSSDPNALLPANAALVNGTKTFNVTLKSLGSFTVTATDLTNGAKTPNTSTPVTVNPGTASKLVVAVQPSATALAGVPFAQQPVVLIEDAYGNVRSNDTLTVTAARSGGAGTLQGTTAMAAVGGVVTFTNLAHAYATNITISFTSGGLTTALSSPVAVSAGPFSQLLALLPGQANAPATLTGASGTASAGVGTNVPVRLFAADTYFNPVTGVTDTVHLATSDAAAVLPPDLALVDGTNTANLFFQTIGTQTVTVTDVTDPGKTPYTNTVTVGAGPFVKLQLLLPGETAAPGTPTGKTGTPLPQTAGTVFTVTVNAVDAYWNLVTTANGSSYTVKLASSDPNATMPNNKDLGNGTLTQNVTLKTAGTTTLTASDVDDATKTPSTSPSLTVNTGTFTKLQVLMPGETAAPGSTSGKTGTPTAQTAGVPFSVTVNAVDANWNPIATNDTVHLASSDANAVLPTDTALVGGTVSLSVTLKTAAANRTVTASDVTHPGIASSTSANTTLNPGPFVQLQVLLPGETAAAGTSAGKTGTPNAQTAGTAFNATVNAVDALWNVVKTNPVIAITSSDLNATLPANAALNNGTKNNFSVTFKTAGTWTVTATDQTDPTAPATSAPATVNAGALVKLQLLVPGETAAPGTPTGKVGTPATQTSNVAFSVTVHGVDANWNPVSTNDVVQLYSSDTNAILPSSTALVAGTQTFNVSLLTVGTATLTASNATHSVVALSVSAPITVQSGTVVVPTITSITPQPDGNMQLDCAGAANQTYYIQASPDLSAWNNLSTNAADSAGHLLYLDLEATNHPIRFYRMMAP